MPRPDPARPRPDDGAVRVLLNDRAMLSVAEMAAAAGLPADRVKSQSEGQAALSVAESERLALAVAQRLSESVPRTA